MSTQLDPRQVRGGHRDLLSELAQGELTLAAQFADQDSERQCPTGLSGIGLGTVLRCYLAGYVLIENFVMQETGSSDLRDRDATLRSIQETHSFLLDDLIASVSREYAYEAQRVSSSPQRRTAERVRRLLAGEILDTEQLGYRMDTWHLESSVRGACSADPRQFDRKS